MATIERGARVLARTSSDRMLERVAVTGVVQGMDFPVVWICGESEWKAANAAGREPEVVPWPASAIQLAATLTSEPPQLVAQSRTDARG